MTGGRFGDFSRMAVGDAKYEKQLKGLKNPTGKDRIPGSKSYKKRMQKIDSVQTLLTQARQKVADKRSRGGPGGKSKLTTAQRKQIKKAGGPVIKKRGGGMTRQGLYPAEEARSGTMSEAKRKRYMNKGGKVSYRNMGGVVGGRMPSKDVVRYLYEISDQIDY